MSACGHGRDFCRWGEVLIESAISGRELTCGVLGKEALPPVLILPHGSGYFDYSSKYAQGGATEICPAPLSEEINRHLMESALLTHKLLGAEGYSRTDFILDEAGKAYVLEVNTLPGMTPTSLIHQEAAAVGIGFGELLERLLDMGVRRLISSSAS